MLNITNNQGNANTNQNHSEVSRLTSQNGHHQNKNKNTMNTSWQGCRKKWIHIHCCLECKLETVWRFFRKLKIKLPYDPATPLLDIHLKKQKHQLAKILYPSVHSNIAYNTHQEVNGFKKKMHTHSAIKKNEILSFVATWMDLEGIMLSEISQKEKYYMILFICGM